MSIQSTSSFLPVPWSFETIPTLFFLSKTKGVIKLHLGRESVNLKLKGDSYVLNYIRDEASSRVPQNCVLLPIPKEWEAQCYLAYLLVAAFMSNFRGGFSSVCQQESAFAGFVGSFSRLSPSDRVDYIRVLEMIFDSLMYDEFYLTYPGAEGCHDTIFVSKRGEAERRAEGKSIRCTDEG